MKKVLSFLLVLTFIATFLVLPAAAAPKNHKVDIQYVKKAPVLDGEVKTGEYGLKIHSVDYNNDQFISAFDPTKAIKADFYMAWTDDSLYMAWVVFGDEHTPIPEDYEGGLAHMWMYSCVQFMLSTGAPDASKKVYQTSDWAGNYLEVGLSVMADGSSYKVAWSLPDGGKELTVDDWDFSGKRDEAKKTTTYEIRLPWKKTGIDKVGNDVQIGLTYAVANQEIVRDDAFSSPIKDNVKMAEWQDGILGGKNMDGGAVITLKGKDKDVIVDIEKDDPTKLPKGKFEVPEGSTELDLDFNKINATIATGSTSVITKIDSIKNYNVKYSNNIHLTPVSGKKNTYSVVAVAQGSGDNPNFELKKGDVVLAFHTDGEGAAGFERAELSKKIVEGDVVVFQGYDLAKGELVNSDPVVYVEKDLATVEDDESDDISDDESDDELSTEDSEDDSVTDDDSEDKDESVAQDESKADESKEETKEDSNTILWIIGIVVALLAIGAGVFFATKKKKLD